MNSDLRSPLQPPVPGWRWDRLDSTVAVMLGLGALGSPLSDHLLSLGIRNFVLCDPKKYKNQSIHSQCEPCDVGRFKVQVVASRLRRQGAKVVAWPAPVEHMEPGWAGPDSVVIASLDRKSALAASNQLALQMRRPFFKVNIEPSLLIASIRFFDFSRSQVPVCLECGWSQDDYRTLDTVTSCEAPAERSTSSPRALSSFTAGWAAMSIVSTIVNEKSSSSFLSDREILFSASGQCLISTELPGNPHCLLSPHGGAGRLVRVAEGPGDVSFQSLAERARVPGTQDLSVCGSGQLAMRFRCDRCGEEVEGCRWIRDPARPKGRCRCGGPLFAVPFFTYSSWRPEELGGRWSLPLRSLGVGRKAAITLVTDQEQVTFILA